MVHKKHDPNDLRPVRVAFNKAMSEATHAPAGPDGCMHGSAMQWYWWVVDDPIQPNGLGLAVACNQCGSVLSGGATLDNEE